MAPLLNFKDAKEAHLSLQEIRLPSLTHTPISMALHAGELGVMTGSTRILTAVFELLIQQTFYVGGKMSFGPFQVKVGEAPQEQIKLQDRYPWVSAMFPNRFSEASWIENLDLDENILLSGQWFGENSKKLRLKADKLARECGLSSLPNYRRSEASMETLALSQWIRTFLNRHARLFVLYEPFKEVPSRSIPALIQRLEKKLLKGTAFLWMIENWNQAQADILFSHFQNQPVFKFAHLEAIDV